MIDAEDRGGEYCGLHVLADDDPRWPKDPVEQAREACAGGAPIVQALAWAEAIREITRAAGARFVVNDRFDLALLAEADAVHFGQDDLPPNALPRDVRARLAVGRSTHTPEQLRATKAKIMARFDAASTATFATSRVWDDGIVEPTETREALALALAVAGNVPIAPSRYGTFRM